MANWTLPAELDQPLPRIAKHRSVFTLLIVSQAFSFVFFIAIIAATMGPLLYKTQMLKERGVIAAGVITNLYTSSGSKGRTNYNVTYAYPLVPRTAFMATDQTDRLRFSQLHVGDDVPIAYDPVYPPRSGLNFDNIVFTRDNIFLAAFVGIMPLFMLLVPCIFIVSYRRQRRLLQWGKAAAATIVSDTEYNAGKQGRKAAVTYSFTDESGRVVQGKRTGLAVKKSRTGDMYQEMFGDPTVLYDPDDSSKNMLYPLALVDCPPRPQPSIFSAR